MDQSIKITFSVSNTNPTVQLGFETWLDDQIVFDTDHVQQPTEISFPVNNTEMEHVLKMILKNKCIDHTTVNDAGEITSDAVLEISNLAFDGIPLGQIVTNNAVYTHDFNGTGTPGDHRFFGTMGCNGTVTLEFTTPIYIWLLENM
jgi:hypothetical protein